MKLVPWNSYQEIPPTDCTTSWMSWAMIQQSIAKRFVVRKTKQMPRP